MSTTRYRKLKLWQVAHLLWEGRQIKPVIKGYGDLPPLNGEETTTWTIKKIVARGIIVFLPPPDSPHEGMREWLSTVWIDWPDAPKEIDWSAGTHERAQQLAKELRKGL